MSKTERIWRVPVAAHDIPEAGRRFDLDAGGFVAASDPALNITARVLQRLAQPAQ